MELHEAADAVHDWQTFLDFARQLIHDREDEVEKEKASPSHPCDRGANGWENGTIEAFLDAACSWAESTRFGETQGLPFDNPWRKFAAFLYCGKIYE